MLIWTHKNCLQSWYPSFGVENIQKKNILSGYQFKVTSHLWVLLLEA